MRRILIIASIFLASCQPSYAAEFPLFNKYVFQNSDAGIIDLNGNPLTADELTADELAAINGANAPTAANPMATMADTSVAEWGAVTGTLSDQTDLQTALDAKPAATNVLEINNTTAFTPTADYHPATKKYVDDNGGSGATASTDLTDFSSTAPVTTGQVPTWNTATSQYEPGTPSGSAIDASFPQISTDTTITSCDRTFYAFTGAATATLPSVSASANCCFENVTGANAISVCAASGETLFRNGTDGSAGGCVETSTLNESLCVGYYDSDTWRIMGETAWTVASNGFDTTNITLWYNAESLDITSTSGTTEYSAGDKIFTLNDFAEINVTAAFSGVNGLYIPTIVDFLDIDPAGIITSAEGRVGMWINMQTFDANGTVFILRYAGTGDMVSMWLNGTGEIQMRWADNTTNTPANLTSVGAGLTSGSGWKFLEFSWNTTTNKREIRIDNVSVGTSTLNIDPFAGAVTKMNFGEVFANGAPVYYLDHILITSDSEESLYEARGQLNYDNS